MNDKDPAFARLDNATEKELIKQDAIELQSRQEALPFAIEASKLDPYELICRVTPEYLGLPEITTIGDKNIKLVPENRRFVWELDSLLRSPANVYDFLQEKPTRLDDLVIRLAEAVDIAEMYTLRTILERSVPSSLIDTLLEKNQIYTNTQLFCQNIRNAYNGHPRFHMTHYQGTCGNTWNDWEGEQAIPGTYGRIHVGVNDHAPNAPSFNRQYFLWNFETSGLSYGYPPRVPRAPGYMNNIDHHSLDIYVQMRNTGRYGRDLEFSLSAYFQEWLPLSVAEHHYKKTGDGGIKVGINPVIVTYKTTWIHDSNK